MTWQRSNRILAAIIILINMYVIAMPLYPAASLWWRKHVGGAQKTFDSYRQSSNSSSKVSIPDGEWLVIPKLLMKQQILEGQSIYTVNKGVWHYPQAGSPGSGNTVLIGHRFVYSGTSAVTFYHLDLLRMNDDIIIFWNGRQYNYRVSDIKVVDPSDVAVEKNTSAEQLTLYTCTPLWSTKHRLVIIASRAS